MLIMINAAKCLHFNREKKQEREQNGVKIHAGTFLTGRTCSWPGWGGRVPVVQVWRDIGTVH